jgi:RNA polymerase sigma-70 factor (ECF subfamily)
MSARDGEVTALLERWSAGETGALSELVPLVYADLRRLAGRSLRRERGDHTLQPTALVHEAYLRLAGSRPPELESREHFLCMAARLMRQILVDHARRVQAARRGGQVPKVPLEEAGAAEAAGDASTVDLLALDRALDALAVLDARKARVVELRFFGGFEVKEVARLLDVSVPTVVADTRFARAWLLARIDAGRPP